MSDLAMVMPMAGRGSRFAREGIAVPKPLVDLEGRPFFWWATQSVLRVTQVRQLVFVVLQEHVDAFAIDRVIRGFYPDAEIVAIPDITAGASETARIGMEAIDGDGPVVVNDCDHAFHCPDLPEVAARLGADAAGALMCFRSGDPAYSYAELDTDGHVVGTVEKRVVSPFAIAGCYSFASAAQFLGLYEEYQASCPYDELFVSGMYNLLIARGETVLKAEAERHLSFGTPAERDRIAPQQLAPFANWL